MRSRPPAKKAFVGLGQSGINTDKIQRGRHVSLRRVQAVGPARDAVAEVARYGGLHLSNLRPVQSTRRHRCISQEMCYGITVHVSIYCTLCRRTCTRMHECVLYLQYKQKYCPERKWSTNSISVVTVQNPSGKQVSPVSHLTQSLSALHREFNSCLECFVWRIPNSVLRTVAIYCILNVLQCLYGV